MKNNKKKEIPSAKKLLKFFTESTCRAIKDQLEDIDVNYLIEVIFLKSNDTDIEYMIKEYEKQLILYKINEEKFKENLHDFFLTMHKYIDENNLYEKFFKLVHMVYISLNKKQVDRRVLLGYQNLLVQQYAYFGGSTKNVVYGLTNSNKKILTISEIGHHLTEINYEMNQFVKNPREFTWNKMKNVLSKYGYGHFKDMYDLHEAIANDQVLTNMLYQMAYFIDDENKELLPIPFRQPCNLVNPNKVFLERDFVTFVARDIIRDKLTQRQILLPTDGINCLFENNGEVKELFLTETIKDDNIILLFKVKFTDNTYTLGFYDTANEVYYDMWQDSSQQKVATFPLENIVLQNYLYLTCSLEQEEKFNLIDFRENNEKNKFANAPLVSYNIRQKSTVKGKPSYIYAKFDKSKYFGELKNVAPFLRKLPLGASASDEAVQMAKKLGIDLPIGYTLVRGFKRVFYTVDKK